MEIKEVTMYVAVCTEEDHDWESNPHLTEADAEDAYNYHVAEVHKNE